MMVDSGDQMNNGYNTYKAMIETSLARSPQENIVTGYTRVDNQLKLDIRVNDQSVTPLFQESGESVHAIIYVEDHVALTVGYVQTVVSQFISLPLVNGAIASYVLSTNDITGINWNHVYSVALVDYRPSSTLNAYDTLQASVPKPKAFSAIPNSLIFPVNSSNGSNGMIQMPFEGTSLLARTITNLLL